MTKHAPSITPKTKDTPGYMNDQELVDANACQCSIKQEEDSFKLVIDMIPKRNLNTAEVAEFTGLYYDEVVERCNSGEIETEMDDSYMMVPGQKLIMYLSRQYASRVVGNILRSQ